MQQRERNPCEYADEDDCREDLDKEDCYTHINLSKFGRGNKNREGRYGDRVDDNIESIKLKISYFFSEKAILKLI